MEREGGDVERLAEVVVVEGFVGTVLAHVGRHANGVEHEVEGTSEVFHCLIDKRAEVVETGGIGSNDGAAVGIGKSLKPSHAEGERGVGENHLGAFGESAFGHLPGNRFVVEGTGDDAFLSFQQFHRAFIGLYYPSDRR